MNSCPGVFCCCVKLDNSYQALKIAEIFCVNQQGALEKQLDRAGRVVPLDYFVLVSRANKHFEEVQNWLKKTIKQRKTSLINQKSLGCLFTIRAKTI